MRLLWSFLSGERSRKGTQKKLWGAVSEWRPPWTQEERKQVYELITESLDSVLTLISYEDSKAHRVLSSMAFISALAGVLFINLAPSRDGVILAPEFAAPSFRSLVFTCFYGLFFVFSVLAISGGFTLVLAIRPRFHIPRKWAGYSEVKSRLFAMKIADACPSAWVSEFSAVKSGTGGEDASAAANCRATIGDRYLRDKIYETYLLSEKLAMKMRVVEIACNLLLYAWLTLLIWVVTVPFVLMLR